MVSAVAISAFETDGIYLVICTVRSRYNACNFLQITHERLAR